MKKLFIIPVFLFAGITAKSQSQEDNFRAFMKTEKTQMLKDYAHHDVADFKKHFNVVLTRFNKLNDKEKQQNKWELQEGYYLLADACAVAGDKKSAIDYLKKSEDDDYNDFVQDHDLDNLRNEPEFIKLMNAIKNKQSGFLVTLQKAPPYNTNEKGDLPQFTYQSQDDPNLVALKNAYNLDSVAGKGNDISRMINLMEWVHYLVPHDGSKGNPALKNAMSLIKECRNDHKTLNCRGLAIILNEVYLAEGFKSRFVTCLPKDTADQDCHVITMAWSTSMNKWIWMDPTFMAYVMNENGELLGLEDVRERLISKKPLILNPDANRNHETSQTKGDYLGNYMAKNLYKLECPLNSQFNYETKEESKARTYMQLLPGSSRPATEVKEDKHGIASYTLYYTNNPKAFWATPPVTDLKGPALVKSNADYEQVMDLFKNYYNLQQVDNIVNLFSDNWGERKKSIFTDEEMKHFIAEYGHLISYKYVAQDDGDGDHNTALFKMVFDKSVHMMGISIDKDNKFENFRPETSSPYIDKLLAKEL